MKDYILYGYSDFNPILVLFKHLMKDYILYGYSVFQSYISLIQAVVYIGG